MPVKKLDIDLIPQMKRQEIRAKRRVLARTLEGSWNALLKGRGMEFAGFRKYEYGDDASRIDWGASLRAKETLIREFEEYKNVNVLFLFDVSDTMLFGSQKKLKAEYAAEMIFNFAVAILDNGDSVGYVMFNDDIIVQRMPTIGTEAVYEIAGALSNPKNYGGKKDFRKVVTSVNVLLKQKSLIIIVSDFIGLSPGWERYIRMLSEKFDLIGIMIRDPRDRELPDMSGQFLLEDPFTDERIQVDLKDYRKIFRKHVEEEELYIKGVFDAAKAGLIQVTTDKDIQRVITDYFRRARTVKV